MLCDQVTAGSRCRGSLGLDGLSQIVMLVVPTTREVRTRRRARASALEWTEIRLDLCSSQHQAKSGSFVELFLSEYRHQTVVRATSTRLLWCTVSLQ